MDRKHNPKGDHSRMSITTIYNFHADEIRPAKSESDLKEWEAYMISQVKLDGFKVGTTDMNLMTTSCCGGRCDDCDMAQN